MSRRSRSTRSDDRRRNSDERGERRPRRPFRSSKNRSSKNSEKNESAARSVRINPAQKRAAEALLSGIGVPEKAEFKPDDFQLEALAALEHQDVLVTAPTGSGKTWIAREEIRRLLADGKRAWYTTPLKALTNSKYQEFIAEFGAENVGILTGDRKENYAAPLIVGTTEIYRNQLFDALREGEQVRADLVILDEAHYLGDEDRGHVWEEAIILSPPRIRLLLLSATIGNAKEFAEWIGDVRGTSVRVVARPGARPVELRAAYLTEDLQLLPLFDQHDTLNPLIRQLSEQRRDDGRFARYER